MVKIGAWLIGARGALATTAIVGARAIVHGLAAPHGLVTELGDVAALPLLGLDDLVFGGWDVGSHTLLDRARTLAVEHQALPGGLVAAVQDDLLAVDQRIRPGFLEGGGPAARALASRESRRRREPLAAAVERLGEDLHRFRAEHKLETVIVVNVASTEPPMESEPAHQTLEGMQQLVQRDRRASVSPSMAYAYTAFEQGFPYVNFTASTGVSPPGLQELGHKHGVPFYGSDGKTGETLMKTALAPLFKWRNLEVLSWDGFNILGGDDGRVLNDPRHRESKIRSKAAVLQSVLGYLPNSTVGIEYVPSLGNWKTAWDHIHFRGFLGTKMTAQFVWQGCDSILAAPLVLDLIRLTEFAHRRREVGPMSHLAFFFKNPMGVKIQSLPDQYRMLLDYVDRHAHGHGGRARG